MNKYNVEKLDEIFFMSDNIKFRTNAIKVGISKIRNHSQLFEKFIFGSLAVCALRIVIMAGCCFAIGAAFEVQGQILVGTKI